MTHHTAAFLRLAVLVCLTGGVSVALAAPSETASAQPCLSAPNGPAPAGERWYYRIDRATKKKCWYARAKTQTPATQQTAAINNNVPAAAPPLERSVADARAELTQPADAGATAPRPVFPDPSATTTVSPSSDAGAGFTVADRWTRSPSVSTDQAQPDTTAQPEPLPATPAVAPAQSTYSPWMLLVIFGGVLALAGLVMALVTQVSRRAGPVRLNNADRRAALWANPQERDNDITVVDTGREPPMNWIRVAREEADARGRQIESLLSGTSRRPVT